MRAHLLSGLALALAGLALPACSALGLDHLPQADCVQGSGGLAGDAFCASLADRIPPPDQCTTWQCNPATHHCEEQPRDDDEDNVPGTTYMTSSGMFMCTPSGPTDCDDREGVGHDNWPGNTETCDGLDQDCDGVADNGALNIAMATSLGTVNAGQDQSLFAAQIDADEEFLVARYATLFRAYTIGDVASPNDLAFSQPPGGAITPQGFDGAVTPIGHGRYALVTRRTSGCPQWSIFPVDSGMAPVTLRTGDQTLMPACPGSGTQVLSAPSIAAIPTGATDVQPLLLAWLAGAQDTRSCGASPALPVTVSGATFDTRITATNRVSTDVLTLGQSVGDGPPAVLALPDAFVVAYPRADATIAVHFATVTADMVGIHVTVSTTPDYVEPAGSSPPQGVTLALGATDRTGHVDSIALSYMTGCTGENPITVRVLTRHGAGTVDDPLTLTGSSTPTTNIGTGPTRSQLRVIYQPRATGGEWLVSWRSGMNLSAQRLFHDGAAAGAPFDIANMVTLNTYTVEALAASDKPLYRAILLSSAALTQITFGCAPAM